MMSDIKFLDLLDHYCIENASLHVHPRPAVHECPQCSVKFNDENLAKAGQTSPICPTCGVAMVSQPPQQFGELHADLCVDKTRHYPEMLASGEITPDEYSAWYDTLSDREKMGFYEREMHVHLCIQFNHAEIALHETNPKAFSELVQGKLRARAELSLQHDHQHRYTAQHKRAEQFVTGFRK